MCGTFYAPALKTVVSRRAGLPGALCNLVQDDELLEQAHTVYPLRGYALVRAEAGGTVLAPARWGWQRSFAKRGLTLARDDRLGDSGLWRPAAATRRCLVPALAWHEWTGPTGSRQRWSLRPQRKRFTLAGLWEATPAGAAFAIVTTAAHPTIAQVHDRMPVALGPDHAAAWLDSEQDWDAVLARAGASEADYRATTDADD